MDIRACTFAVDMETGAECGKVATHHARVQCAGHAKSEGDICTEHLALMRTGTLTCSSGDVIEVVEAYSIPLLGKK